MSILLADVVRDSEGHERVSGISHIFGDLNPEARDFSIRKFNITEVEATKTMLGLTGARDTNLVRPAGGVMGGRDMTLPC